MADSDDTAALEAEVQRLMEEIAAAQPKTSRLPGRSVPNSGAARLVALNRQLAAAKLRLGQARAKAAR